jgi:hypothetical protein
MIRTAQIAAETLLVGLILESLAACGGGSTSAAPFSSAGGNPTTTSLSDTSGSLTFPTVTGNSGSASYALISAPPNGTIATLSTQNGGSGLPAPLGSNASVLIAFTLSVSQTVSLSTYPAWTISMSSGTTLMPPYAIEAFDGTANAAEYIATVSGSTISAQHFGGPTILSPGHSYIFEVVQNSDLTQFPH